MQSFDPEHVQIAPFDTSRHRVDAPENYESWREYAYSSDDSDGLGPLEQSAN